MLGFTFFLLDFLISPQNPPPAQSRFLEVKVGNKALLEMISGTELVLPQLRVYDRKGFQVAELDDGPSFPATLTKVLQSPPKALGKTLQSETKILVDKTGKPLKDLPDADFTIVEYWAEWCESCHAQVAQLKEVIASQPRLSITVLHAEADPLKIPELQGKVKQQKDK